MKLLKKLLWIFFFSLPLFSFGLAATPGTLKWNFDVQGKILSEPAVGSDGTIYVTSDSNHLWAINPDGTKKWAYPLTDIVLAPPVLSKDGSLIHVLAQGVLYAISLTGQWTWAVGIDGHAIMTGAQIDQSTGNIVFEYFNNRGAGNFLFQSIVKVSPSGKLLWNYPIYNSPCAIQEKQKSALSLWRFALASHGGVFSTLPNSCSVEVLFPLLGAIENWGLYWSSTIMNVPTAFPAIDKTIDALYVPRQDGRMYAYFSNALRPGADVGFAWSIALGSDLSMNIPFVDESTHKIYIADTAGYLYAVNSDGTYEWKAAVSKNAFTYQKVAMDQKNKILYLSDERGMLFAVDAKTGKTLWSHSFFPTLASPTVAPDGTVLVGGTGGYLYAINGGLS